MDDADTHRHIELQSPDDLTYLINNVRSAAADSINAAFPPVDNPLGGDDDDELRNRIEQLVNEYILKTFTLAAPNLTINGLPINPAPFLAPLTTNPPDHPSPAEPQVAYEYAPFDPRKRTRFESLLAEEESLLRSIAHLKRAAPATTASRWTAASQAGIEADAASLRAATDRVAEEGASAGRRALEGMGPLERQEGVEERWEGAVEGLGRLKREMPAAVAKMERARVAAGYVSGE
ncbi:hypothetical protein C8A05DRAFT_31536 [Staphylotrichum tortipilum]|uniref:Kinetochore protein mis14 n=1 Tax=Staphylotrichum tortipilum TaxID=2831512 RepID=A0AAN6MPV9_9PEZI|nr:hypothetical protein C8A05DRAFT_31536 [Staphylotrichum longicolle]